jgi:hypothetical protein
MLGYRGTKCHCKVCNLLKAAWNNLFLGLNDRNIKNTRKKLWLKFHSVSYLVIFQGPQGGIKKMLLEIFEKLLF